MKGLSFKQFLVLKKMKNVFIIIIIVIIIIILVYGHDNRWQQNQTAD